MQDDMQDLEAWSKGLAECSLLELELKLKELKNTAWSHFKDDQDEKAVFYWERAEVVESIINALK